MAEKSNRQCNHPGCSALVKYGYCYVHKSDYDLYRGTAAERGYDGVWRKFRKAVLRQNPLCQDCLREGFITPSKEVHHIKKLRDYPELRLVRSNLLCLCTRHHNVRTLNGE